MRTTRFSSLVLILLSCVLLAPVLAIPFQDIDSLQSGRNKVLETWPASCNILSRPAEYFQKIGNWIDDRIGLGLTANTLLRESKYYIFGDPPAPNITLSGEYIFLNYYSDEPKKRFASFKASCIGPGFAGNFDRSFERLSKSFGAMKDYFGSYGVTPRLLIIPTKPVVYGDRLPESVPLWIREGCVRQMSHSFFSEFSRLEPNAVYPLESFITRRDEPIFYPPERFHFEGASAREAAKEYFSEFDMNITLDDRGHTESSISDLRFAMGFYLPIEVTGYDDIAALETQPYPDIDGFEAKFREFYKNALDFEYIRNNSSVSGRTALVISNSFGKPIRDHIALGYDDLFHINIRPGDLPKESVEPLLQFLMTSLKPNDVIVVLHDQAAIGRMEYFSWGLLP